MPEALSPSSLALPVPGGDSCNNAVENSTVVESSALQIGCNIKQGRPAFISRIVANLYLLASGLAIPIICGLGWVILAQAARKRLVSYVRLCWPLAIGASFSACSILILAFVTYFDRRDYLLSSAAYLLVLIGMPFHIVTFARLWKMSASLPPDPGRLPEVSEEAPPEGVWPPPPRP